MTPIKTPAGRKWATAIIAGALGTGAIYSIVSPPSHADQKLTTAVAPAEAVEHANGLSDAFRYASEHTMPAVVTIQHTMEPKKVVLNQRGEQGESRELPREFRDLDPLFKRFFEDMPELEGIPDLRRMPQQRSQSAGSGVIIEKSGLVLTNNHVVAGGGKVVVVLADGREFEATEVKTDPRTDLAIVRIKAGEDLPVAKLGDSDNVQVGDWVLALGQPFGLSNTLTQGIISAKGRGIGITEHEEFLQTDAAINPGNSGGPLVNLKGEVIGINTAISTTTGGYQGIGFAVPVNVAKWVTQQLKNDGSVHRAYLGVGIQPLTQEIASQLGMNRPRGALVTEVRNGSPAEAAGVKVGDVVTQYAKAPVSNPRQLAAVVARTEIGTKQPIEVIRDGKEITLQVTVQEAPGDYTVSKQENTEEPAAKPNASTEFKDLGLEVAPLTADQAEKLGFKVTSGLVITSVDSDSPAGQAGLQAGMLVERVGSTNVKTVDEFRAAVKAGKPESGVLLLVRSTEGSRFVVLKK